MTPKPKKHKQRFEHKVVEVRTNAEAQGKMNDLEQCGWELVTVAESAYAFDLFFKRPV